MVHYHRMITPLSTEPYRGTRDFYPEDKAIQKHIFSVMRTTAERFGYVEYDASLLEETALYEAKTGNEIVTEQTYSFTDRGSRKVTIRPEMTPTVARMIARKRKELAFPLRWYSVPNLFRYERPQRGRLREHWQLNADLFGVASREGDVEIIMLAFAIMRAFGADAKNFAVMINSRHLTDALFSLLRVSGKHRHDLSALIDRRAKMEEQEFLAAAEQFLGTHTETLMTYLNARSIEELPQSLRSHAHAQDVEQLLLTLRERGVTNARFAPDLIRGFEYYTGSVFEVFDADPKNSRSLFGGGRYDDLLRIFGVEPVPAVGFGMGDVTIRDFLETHQLLPQLPSVTHLYIGTVSPQYVAAAEKLAGTLREDGINVAVDLTDRKVPAQMKTAVRQNIPFFLVMGEEEVTAERYKLKNLHTREEVPVRTADLAATIREQIGV